MIFVTGDMHGDYKIFKQPIYKNIKKSDTLVICGDFGFIWTGDKNEKSVLDKLAKKNYTICFVDGTHENFDLLAKYPVVEFCGGLAHKIRENIYHLMRGQIFEIEGEKIFAMGGGESPDIDIRSEGDSWSREEIPTREELLAGAHALEAADYHVDMVITHEPPLRIKGFLQLKDYDSLRVTALNAYFEELSDSCTFDKWYFGSMHMDKYISKTHIAVFKAILNAETGEKV